MLAASFPNDPASFDGVTLEPSVGHLLLNRVHRLVFVDIGRHHNPVLLQLINLHLRRYFVRHVVVCHTATLVPPGVGPSPTTMSFFRTVTVGPQPRLGDRGTRSHR